METRFFRIGIRERGVRKNEISDEIVALVAGFVFSDWHLIQFLGVRHMIIFSLHRASGIVRKFPL